MINKIDNNRQLMPVIWQGEVGLQRERLTNTPSYRSNEYVFLENRQEIPHDIYPEKGTIIDYYI